MTRNLRCDRVIAMVRRLYLKIGKEEHQYEQYFSDKMETIFIPEKNLILKLSDSAF